MEIIPSNCARHITSSDEYDDTSAWGTRFTISVWNDNESKVSIWYNLYRQYILQTRLSNIFFAFLYHLLSSSFRIYLIYAIPYSHMRSDQNQGQSRCSKRWVHKHTYWWNDQDTTESYSNWWKGQCLTTRIPTKRNWEKMGNQEWIHKRTQNPNT